MAIDNIVTFDGAPAMADVFSGAVPRPHALRRGENVAAWARRASAILTLGRTWGVDVATVAPAPRDEELIDALGDGAACVTLGGRVIALNTDGTRAAYRQS